MQSKLRIDENGRVCSKCGDYKFWRMYSRGNSACGYKANCRACDAVHHQTVPYEHRRDQAFRNALWNNHRLSLERRQAILVRQGGKCAAPDCQVVDTPEARLTVDHDHRCCPGDKSCGDCVRGLLCKPHNWAAGTVEANLWAVKYLGLG